MSAPSRREAKKRFITFILVVEAQEMIVTYQPNWMTDVGHFEFRSPEEPPRRIPVSETAIAAISLRWWMSRHPPVRRTTRGMLHLNFYDHVDDP